MLKYPFDEMNVGDSLFIPLKSEEENVKKLGNRIAQLRQAHQKRMAKRGEEVRFTQRMWTEDGVAGTEFGELPDPRGLAPLEWSSLNVSA